MVFDCGAMYKGTSLNCQLLQGPNLTHSLICILIRFRQEPRVVDIQAMFHQVRVSEKDIRFDFLCFLWWP